MALEILSIVIFSLVTSLREILEAALIIGIILGYLRVINRNDLRKDVLYGVLSAIAFSLVIGVLFIVISNKFGEFEKLFEATIMLIAAGIITWVVLWINNQKKSIRSNLESEMSKVISSKHRTSFFLLVFFSVAREGGELVLLLYSSYISFNREIGFIPTISSLFAGFTIGLALAIFLSLMMYKTSYKFEIRKFFMITSVILIIFAAGLIAHGLHELYEFLEESNSFLVSLFIWNEVYDINNTFIGDLLKVLFSWSYDPIYPLRFEKSVVGSILVGLFGWNDNPSLIELVAYVSYVIMIAFWTRNKGKSTEKDVSEVQSI
ncbi:MAG: FTR1 family iron permease [Candidatus Hodarchaeales archaeon]